ncbi:MAG: hypothetical protein ACSHXK_11455 [Oceanococcus sp.]
MAQSAELEAPHRLAFCFTGGEPFLDFELLLPLVAAGERMSLTAFSLAALLFVAWLGYWNLLGFQLG